MVQFEFKDIDELIKLTRKFAETGDTSTFKERISKAKEIAKKAYGQTDRWSCIYDFVNALVGIYNLNECTDGAVYEALKAIGIAVVDKGV